MTEPIWVDKQMIRRIIMEQNAKIGFVPDPTATPERSQAMIAERLKEIGLSREDNVFSRGIIAAREE